MVTKKKPTAKKKPQPKRKRPVKKSSVKTPNLADIYNPKPKRSKSNIPYFLVIALAFLIGVAVGVSLKTDIVQKTHGFTSLTDNVTTIPKGNKRLSVFQFSKKDINLPKVDAIILDDIIVDTNTENKVVEERVESPVVKKKRVSIKRPEPRVRPEPRSRPEPRVRESLFVERIF